MTKQEQIEEMGQIICGHCENGICLIDKTSCFGLCEELKAEELYNAGYRKADEVRNETAKEILKILYDQGIDKNIIECCSIYDINGILIAKEICEKYGVKVEE